MLISGRRGHAEWRWLQTWHISSAAPGAPGSSPRPSTHGRPPYYQLFQCVNFWIGSRYAGLKFSRCEYATGIIAAC
jgi:hypothetical protein